MQQQAMAAEAARVMRQAVTLAQLHGHAQVTPLHVASAMLSAAGLLRAACLQSHPNPLQWKALELRCKAALNRLPTTIFRYGRQGHHVPAQSNALIAAFRRAKALLRRGSVEGQRQPPMLAVTVELEQLVISMLDDPSVSRVMREAGFSSSQVKANVKKAVSPDNPYTTGSSRSCPNCSHSKLKESEANADDAVRVLDCMESGRKRCVVGGGENVLSPIVIPDGGLALSLCCDSQGQASQAKPRTGWTVLVDAAGGDSVSDLTRNGTVEVTATASLPSWHHLYHRPVHTRPACCGTTMQQQDLRNNYSCNGSKLTLSFSSQAATISPAASFLPGAAHCYTTLISKPWQPWPHHKHKDPIARAYDQRSHANPNPEHNSVSNSLGGTTEAASCRPKFTELTAVNLKILCSELEMRVPRHKDIIPDIASTLLMCRSGMMRRMRRQEKLRSATCLLFQGRDSGGKKAMAQELAKLIFESFTPVDSYYNFDVELTLERQRSSDNELGFVERLYKAICENPHRVIMIDNIDRLDYDWEINIKNAVENGKMRSCNGGEVSLEDAIIVLSCEKFNSKPRSCCPWVKHRVNSLDLNACAEANGEKEEESLLNDAGILSVVDGVFFFQSM